ncbi:hypothetical protein FXW78_49870 [Rhodococcus opacus]|nr:hypothetical protein [Rhodococcus opacus]
MLEEVRAVGFNLVGGPLRVTGGQGVIDGLGEQFAFGEPVGRGAVELFDPLGVIALDPAP